MKKPSKGPKKQKPAGKQKQSYKVRNWKEYNAALVNRGSTMFWITEEVLGQWNTEQRTGKRGRPQEYSNIAIETTLTLQQVFRLPLRQTEGFVGSILRKFGAACTAPDYSTLSVRAHTLPIRIRVRPLRKEGLHIVVDSTGAKVYGEGEWKVRQHGWSKRRTWRKLHIGVDEETGDILLGDVTGNGVSDGEMLDSLLDQLPAGVRVDQVSADGAYDTRPCYAALQARTVPRIAIPPRHDAKIWRHGNTDADPLPRDKNLRRIRKIGRKRWKTESGYHRRSIAETTMFRLKTVFGDRISARLFVNQRTQLLLRCRALNRMTALGMPDSCLAA